MHRNKWFFTVGWLNDCLVIKLTVGSLFFCFFNIKSGYESLELWFSQVSYQTSCLSASIPWFGKNGQKQQGATNTCNYRSFTKFETWKYFKLIFGNFLCLFNHFSLFALLKTVLTIIFTYIVTWWQETDASMSYPKR